MPRFIPIDPSSLAHVTGGGPTASVIADQGSTAISHQDQSYTFKDAQSAARFVFDNRQSWNLAQAVYYSLAAKLPGRYQLGMILKGNTTPNPSSHIEM
jgi:hypothetical protein